MTTMRLMVVVALASSIPRVFHAQVPLAGSPGPSACANADRHRFDFWIGEWDVKTPAGGLAGTSSVQSVSGGCALLENWTATNGGTGKSLNAYNPVSKQWQQYWAGQGGAVTEYRESEWKDGSLSFMARGSAPSAAPMQRLTFTPVNDSTVRQHGESSADGGATWTTTYDFYYHRRR